MPDSVRHTTAAFAPNPCAKAVQAPAVIGARAAAANMFASAGALDAIDDNLGCANLCGIEALGALGAQSHALCDLML